MGVMSERDPLRPPTVGEVIFACCVMAAHETNCIRARIVVLLVECPIAPVRYVFGHCLWAYWCVFRREWLEQELKEIAAEKEATEKAKSRDQ